ncbi:MAG TPA: MMPL family transporter, partial [Trebonia sp.]|nr:MMPL family transporter [Trebonia sp.]
GLAFGAIAAVVLVMAAALTLLPGLLGYAGRAIDRFKVPRLHSTPDPGARTGWYRWSRVIQRHPWLSGSIALAILLTMAIPVFSLQMLFTDAGNDPTTVTTRRAYDLLADGFGPGFNGPLVLVAQASSPADAAALQALETRLPSVADVASVQTVAATSGTRVIQVTPRTSPQDTATFALISTLRDRTIPAAERGTTLRVYVGGVSATNADFTAAVIAKLPWFLLTIIGLSFLLLVVAFRSLLIPATTAVMNLLGAAAAFGVLTAFFQWGWGTSAFGMGAASPVEAFLPVFMIPILFGLSTDYQVFLVSRMNEEWVRSRDNRRAVRAGQAGTARVITAAATIMICVFVTFSLMGNRDIAEFGIALAAAVALDAFILRTTLVPAVMHMLGNANWSLPGWLDRRLPHLAIEPSAPSSARACPDLPART